MLLADLDAQIAALVADVNNKIQALDRVREELREVRTRRDALLDQVEAEVFGRTAPRLAKALAEARVTTRGRRRQNAVVEGR